MFDERIASSSLPIERRFARHILGYHVNICLASTFSCLTKSLLDVDVPLKGSLDGPYIGGRPGYCYLRHVLQMHRQKSFVHKTSQLVHTRALRVHFVLPQHFRA